MTEQLHSHKSGCQIQEAMEVEADHMKSEGSDFFKHYFGSLSTTCKVGTIFCSICGKYFYLFWGLGRGFGMHKCYKLLHDKEQRYFDHFF